MLAVLSWMVANYKAVLATITVFLSGIAIPLWLASTAFVAKVDSTYATVSFHESRLKRLEEVIIRMDERWIFVEKELIQMRTKRKP